MLGSQRKGTPNSTLCNLGTLFTAEDTSSPAGRAPPGAADMPCAAEPQGADPRKRVSLPKKAPNPAAAACPSADLILQLSTSGGGQPLKETDFPSEQSRPGQPFLTVASFPSPSWGECPSPHFPVCCERGLSQVAGSAIRSFDLLWPVWLV